MPTDEQADQTQLLDAVRASIEASLAIKGRSQTRVLADAMAPINAALDRGIYRKLIVEALNAGGLPVSLTVFANMLYRLRKRTKPRNAPAATPAVDAWSAAAVVPSAPAHDVPRPVGPEPLTLEQVAAENPHLSTMQHRRLLADQFVADSRRDSGLLPGLKRQT